MIPFAFPFPFRSQQRPPRRNGFSLLELLVATSVLALVVIICLTLTNHLSEIIRRSNEVMSVHREGNGALTLISTHLRQAVLDSRPIFVNAAGERVLDQKPDRQVLWSDLMFISGPETALLPHKAKAYSHALFFQTLMGDATYSPSGQALNEIGYFLDCNDGNQPTFISPPRNRLRLMQYRRRAGNTTVQQIVTDARLGTVDRRDWYLSTVNGNVDVQPVANNILAMIIVPKVRNGSGLIQMPPVDRGWSTFSNYLFDSQASGAWQHRMPEILEITLIVGSNESLNRYAERNPGTDFDFGQSSFFSTLTSAGDYQSKLNDFLEKLEGEKIYHRVFSTTIRLEAGGN